MRFGRQKNGYNANASFATNIAFPHRLTIESKSMAPKFTITELSRMLAKSREQRIAGMDEVISEIDNLQGRAVSQ